MTVAVVVLFSRIELPPDERLQLVVTGGDSSVETKVSSSHGPLNLLRAAILYTDKFPFRETNQMCL